MSKKLLALGLGLLMVFALAACGDSPTPSTSPTDSADVTSTTPDETASPDDTGTEPTDTPAAGIADRDPSLRNKEVIASISSQPETIDPQKNSASDGSTLNHHFFEMLTGFGGEDGTEIVPAGAESWEITQEEIDGETRNVYTFKLRPDNKWSDGQTVVAADYEYAMQRLVDPNTESPYAEDMGKYMYNGLAIAGGDKPLSDLGVEAIDETTLRVVQGDKVDLLIIVARSNFAPVRRDIVEADPEGWTLKPETYVTNGRYKMESWTNDAEIVMVRNEGYWDNANVYNDKIIWKLMNDDVARLAAFRAQELDYAEGFPSEEIITLQNEGVWNQSAMLGTYYVDFNNQKAPFDNPKVREAFTLAIDSPFIAKTVMQDTVVPANAYVGPGHITPDGGEFYNEAGYYDLNTYEANQERARQALADAGYPDGEGFPVVEYIYNNTATHKVIAEALQNMWQTTLNVQVEINVMEWNVMLDVRRKGEFDIARDGWLSDFNDPISLLGLMYSSSGNNNGQYKNPEFDALIDKIGQSDDQNERFTLMRQAEDMLMADWACGPVYFYSRMYLRATNFTGNVNTPLGNVFLWNARYE